MKEILENIDAAVMSGLQKAAARALVEPAKRVVDIRVIAEPSSSWVLSGCRTMEDRARALESWAIELEKFVRDHRSQDGVSLTVEREKAVVCSGCGADWEECPPDEYDDKPYCANCGANVRQTQKGGET